MSRSNTSTSSFRASAGSYERRAFVTHGQLERVFEANSQQLKPLLLRLDTGFTTLGHKTDKLQDSLTALDDKTNARLYDIEISLHNMACANTNRGLTRLHNKIEPPYLPGSKDLPGKLLPRTVGDLLKLELTPNYQWLAKLLDAYQVDDWRLWPRTEFESYQDNLLCDDEPDTHRDLDQGPQTPERRYTSALQAIQYHPHDALECLASRLGLEFRKIYEEQQRVRAQQSQAQVVKRQGESLLEENVKRIPSANPHKRAPPQPESSHFTPDGFTVPSEVIEWAHESPPSGRRIKVFQDCTDPVMEHFSSTPGIPLRPSTRDGETTVADDSSADSADS